MVFNRRVCSKLLFLLGFMFFGETVHAQVYFDIGYGFGFGKPKDLSQMLYIYNKVNKPDKEFKTVKVGHGPVLGVGLGDDAMMVELRFQNLVSKISSEQLEYGVNQINDLKFRKRTIAANVLFGDRFKFGFGLETGTFRFFGRRYSSIETIPDYEELSTKKLSKAYAFSLIGEVSLLDFFGIRAGYGWQFFDGTKGQDFSHYLLESNSFGPFQPSLRWGTFNIDLFFRLGGE